MASMLELSVHLPSDERGDYKLPGSVPLMALCALVGAELGVPPHMVLFEDARTGARLTDPSQLLGAIFPLGGRVGLIAIVDEKRPRPQDGRGPSAPLGAPALAPALAPAPAPELVPAPASNAPTPAPAPVAPVQPLAVPASRLRPIIPIREAPHHSSSSAPTSARHPLSARSAEAALPPIAIITAMSLACRELEQVVSAALVAASASGDASPLLTLRAAAAERPAVLRRHGFSSDSDFATAVATCSRVAAALLDPLSAPPGDESIASATADAILQNTGLGLAIVRHTKMRTAEEALARAMQAAEAAAAAAARASPAPVMAPAEAPQAPTESGKQARALPEAWQLVAIGAGGALLVVGALAAIAVVVLRRARV